VAELLSDIILQSPIGGR